MTYPATVGRVLGCLAAWVAISLVVGVIIGLFLGVPSSLIWEWLLLNVVAGAAYGVIYTVKMRSHDKSGG